MSELNHEALTFGGQQIHLNMFHQIQQVELYIFFFIICHFLGKPQVFDWCPLPQQQYLRLTSGGRMNDEHTHNAAAVSVSVSVLLMLWGQTNEATLSGL